ncbi:MULTISPECIES: IclR family transcriptional regulator [Mesorhizobium]|uniref:IclR family transcriptional regulator n=1 Tax=Mesorhizobium TaxID=68287 RepID=UPI0003CED0EF|nr:MULTISPECIES: IclR family transcriptional regulator [Mesorhizobium]ESY64046.1 hypothetical protein X742_27045 [Mesorhizobium sp. LNHC232B00]WJI35756.1 IclR family transcriptional regulator [Mesorhizobium opportunistum]
MPTNEVVPGTAALTKGLAVLRAISASGPSARFATLREATKLPKATLSRILKALQVEGLIKVDPRDNGYQLGLAFLRLAFEVLDQMSIRDVAHEEMVRLGMQTSESIHLAVLDGREAVYVDIVESSQPVASIGRLGSISAIHAAASGKVIAANLTPEKLEGLLQTLKLTRLTDNTITSAKVLRLHLAEIRAQGYAFNDEEENIGIKGVASPVFDITGQVVASIGISIPSFRFDRSRLDHYVSAAMETARLVSAKLGSHGRANGSP